MTDKQRLALLAEARTHLNRTTRSGKEYARTGEGSEWKAAHDALDKLAAGFRPTLSLVYPQTGRNLHRPPLSGLHPTLGLAGNWALDFLAPGGTLIVACEAGLVWKVSGHDPASGTWAGGRPDPSGSVYGLSTYIKTSAGFIYFLTHQSSRKVKVGERVKLGQSIGVVGHWPHNEARSHTHLGVTAPSGTKGDAAARLGRVATAPFLAV